MVRMGEEMSPQAKTFISSAVEASEMVADMLKSNFRVDVDAEDMEEVESMLAKQVRGETFRAANSAKYERELDEKYGLLKDIILHPTVQWMMGVCEHLWRNFHLFGKPPLGTTAGVIVAFMIYRKKVGLGNMCLAVAVLSGLNPVVFVVVIVLWKLWVSWGALPKKHKQKMQGTHRSPTGELGRDQLSSDFNPDEISDEDRQYDDIVVGSGLGGLYCAALLARCGRRVLVVEQGPLVGGGAVVKAPKDSGDWEFETGVQCLGGGDSLARHVKRLSLAFVPGTEPLAWEQVGKGESDLSFYDVVSIGSGKQHLVFPSGMDKLLESLTTQFPEKRKLLTALLGQMASSMQTNLVFYLSKIFRVKPDRYVDRVVKSIFVDPSVTNHLTLATRSLRDVMRVMAGGQSESDQGDDLEAAQAAVCALFHRENARPEKVSWIDLMTHTTNSWHGLFHPRGGFRSLAEKLVDSINRSGGRILTRVRANSLIVENGRAVGVSVSKMAGGVGASSHGVSVGKTGGNPVEFRVFGDGAVVSAIGVLETFDKLVSLAEPSLSEMKTSEKLRARPGAGQGQKQTVGAGEDGAGESKSKAKNKEVGGEHKLEPEGFQTLRGARPKVHLCVGLRGNWLEDLDGTAAFVHHVRDSTSIMVGGNPRHPINGEGSWGGPGREREWYRISFMEPKDSGSVSKSTTCCVVTSEMSDDMAEAIGSTKAVTGPRRFVVLPGKSSRERMKERLLRVLHDEFPLTKDRDEFVLLAEEQQPGLSHGPERYMAQGLRAPTKIPGFFLAGEDLTIGSMEGMLESGWIAAHAALGYSPTEMLLKSRSLASDLPNLDKIYG